MFGASMKIARGSSESGVRQRKEQAQRAAFNGSELANQLQGLA